MTEVEIKDKSGHVYRCYEIDGYRIPVFYSSVKQATDIVKQVPNFYCRNDDIMLCTYPKTGTNWMFEIIMMLLTHTAERIQMNKTQTMLEALPPAIVDAAESPRVVNTHLSPRYLPRDLVSKQIKTVLVVRNPKDTAVSYFNHMTGIKVYKYNGKWEDWFPLYIHGKLEYGKYTAYLREWEDIIRNHAKFPLHLVYYEDLHMNTLNELKRLAQFLGVKLSDEFLNNIIDSCSFDKMAKDKLHAPITQHLFKDTFKFFRKGKIGDWKNWFTRAQKQECDALWEEEMAGSMFKFMDGDMDAKSKL